MNNQIEMKKLKRYSRNEEASALRLSISRFLRSALGGTACALLAGEGEIKSGTLGEETVFGTPERAFRPRSETNGSKSVDETMRIIALPSRKRRQNGIGRAGNRSNLGTPCR